MERFKSDIFTTVSSLNLPSASLRGPDKSSLLISRCHASHITRINAHPSLAHSSCSVRDWFPCLTPQADPPVPRRQSQTRSLPFVLTPRPHTTRCPEPPPSPALRRLPGDPASCRPPPSCCTIPRLLTLLQNPTSSHLPEPHLLTPPRLCIRFLKRSAGGFAPLPPILWGEK